MADEKKRQPRAAAGEGAERAVQDPALAALGKVIRALEAIEPKKRQRVMDWAIDHFELKPIFDQARQNVGDRPASSLSGLDPENH